MRGRTPGTQTVLWIIVLSLFAPFQGLGEDAEGSVIGQVTETFQIVTDDGIIYEIVETEMGEEVLNHVGKTIEAVGIIVEIDGIRSIEIRSFIVIQE